MGHDYERAYRYQRKLLRMMKTEIIEGRYQAEGHEDLLHQINTVLFESKRLVVKDNYEEAYGFIINSISSTFQNANRLSIPNGKFSKLWRKLILSYLENEGIGVTFQKMYIACTPTLNTMWEYEKWADMKICLKVATEDFSIQELYVNPTSFFGVRILAELHENLHDHAGTFITSIAPSKGFLSTWPDTEKNIYRSKVEHGAWNECELTKISSSYLDDSISHTALFADHIDEVDYFGIDLNRYAESDVFIWNRITQSFSCRTYIYGILRSAE